MKTLIKSALLLIAISTLNSCSTAYYAAMDQIGFEKRHIVVDRVKDAQKSQVAAKEQFSSALDQFLTATQYRGGDLEKLYRKLESSYARSEKKAQTVKNRNKSVESTGKALFKEWKKEIKQFSDPELAHTSKAQYTASKARYNELLTAMQRAESKLDPVLARFRDQVLFLKHNLNTKAINAMQSQVVRTKSDVTSLILEMERSIAESESFIRDMQ